MKGLQRKIFVMLVLFVLLFILAAHLNISNQYNPLNEPTKIPNTSQNNDSDPSVHLYVNGNGYVVFSANYTIDGVIKESFVNDKSQNFTTNNVPSGTVFHLVSSPNSGYIFQK